MRMSAGGALGMGGKLFFSYFIEVACLEKNSRGTVTINTRNTTLESNSNKNYSLQHDHEVEPAAL